MADQKNRGGQKKGKQDMSRPQQAQGTTTRGEGKRADKDKQQDLRNNPDDARRKATDQQQ